jgi:hypothetical protein
MYSKIKAHISSNKSFKEEKHKWSSLLTLSIFSFPYLKVEENYKVHSVGIGIGMLDEESIMAFVDRQTKQPNDR